MYLQLKFSSGFKEIKLFVYNLFTYYMTKPRIFGMQVEANREVEGPSQKRLVINNSALIIEGTAISGFRNSEITIIVDTDIYTSIITLRNRLNTFILQIQSKCRFVIESIFIYILSQEHNFVRYTCSLKNLKPKLYKGKKQTCKRRRALK